MNIEIDKKVFESFPVLESERLLFREIKLNDAKDLFIIRSNDEVMKFMDTKRLESLEDTEKLIKSINESFTNETGINWSVVEKSSNKMIGYFGYWRIIHEHCRAEIGYALHPEYWKKGYMIETMKSLINVGFHKIKLHSIEANVNPNNSSSIKLLEKIGFRKEAYFRENFLFDGKFLDSIIYSLLEKNFVQ